MVGTQTEFIDTQDVGLRNVTDSIVYTQLTDVTLNIDSTVTKHHLTDDTIDNVFDLRAISISGNMWITSGEWPTLVDLTVDISGNRPVKIWEITWMDQTDFQVDMTINGQLKVLRAIDSGIGAVRLFFEIEGDEVLNIP